MAGHGVVKTFKELVFKFRDVERRTLYRENLGTESQREYVEPSLDGIEADLHAIENYSDHFDDNVLQNVNSHLTEVNNILIHQANLLDGEFAGNASSFRNKLTNAADQLRLAAMPYILSTVQAKDALSIEMFKAITRQMENDLANQTKEATDRIQDYLDSALREAKQEQDKIITHARETAQGFSVEAAQREFKEAAAENKAQALSWGIAAGVLVVGFGFLAWYFHEAPLPSVPMEELKWYIPYRAIIRFGILGLVGTIAMICARLLRANLHMRQHNLHRLRITNSISAFMEAAYSRDQRDLILSRLVDNVAAFGSSGLLQHEDEKTTVPGIAVDSIMKSFGPPPK